MQPLHGALSQESMFQSRREIRSFPAVILNFQVSNAAQLCLLHNLQTITVVLTVRVALFHGVLEQFLGELGDVWWVLGTYSGCMGSPG